MIFHSQKIDFTQAMENMFRSVSARLENYMLHYQESYQIEGDQLPRCIQYCVDLPVLESESLYMIKEVYFDFFFCCCFCSVHFSMSNNRQCPD